MDVVKVLHICTCPEITLPSAVFRSGDIPNLGFGIKRWMCKSI